MTNAKADNHSNSFGRACARPDLVATECAVGTARSLAGASRVFADELARDRDPATFPITTVRAFFSANANLFRGLAAVVRDVTDDIGGRPGERADDEFDVVAESVATHVGTDKSAPPNA
ncbi:MAG TPA: hypothetical protein VJT49_13915 [Amycolatopsis sp.]|uniref:hypothetical protein n=1 Tax=Amycolatopsis sp. TaxID=37632 RepID=UPI002B492538|nr:hypothetical protein [Amycolatopsis sp.]HKS46179.1 hypothetical protein [Amycolatopsis sp.]